MLLHFMKVNVILDGLLIIIFIARVVNNSFIRICLIHQYSEGSGNRGLTTLLTVSNNNNRSSLGKRWFLLYNSLFCLFFGCILSIWKFLGQGLNPSHSHNLCHSCSSNGSLTYCNTAGTLYNSMFKEFMMGVPVVA